MERYIELKESHEKAISKVMSEFRSDKMKSLRDKVRSFRERTFACDSCKKKSSKGMIFTETADTYEVRCGHSSNPCKLHHVARKSKKVPVFGLLEGLEGDMSVLRDALVRMHMDAIFGVGQWSSEEYEARKKELSWLRARYEEVLSRYTSFVKYAAHADRVSELLSRVSGGLADVRRLLGEERPSDADVKEAVSIHTSTLYPGAKSLREIHRPDHVVRASKDSKGNILSVRYVYGLYRTEDLEIGVR